MKEANIILEHENKVVTDTDDTPKYLITTIVT